MQIKNKPRMSGVPERRVRGNKKLISLFQKITPQYENGPLGSQFVPLMKIWAWKNTVHFIFHWFSAKSIKNLADLSSKVPYLQDSQYQVSSSLLAVSGKFHSDLKIMNEESEKSTKIKPLWVNRALSSQTFVLRHFSTLTYKSLDYRVLSDNSNFGSWILLFSQML